MTNDLSEERQITCHGLCENPLDFYENNERISHTKKKKEDKEKQLKSIQVDLRAHGIIHLCYYMELTFITSTENL